MFREKLQAAALSRDVHLGEFSLTRYGAGNAVATMTCVSVKLRLAREGTSRVPSNVKDSKFTSAEESRMAYKLFEVRTTSCSLRGGTSDSPWSRHMSLRPCTVEQMSECFSISW